MVADKRKGTPVAKKVSGAAKEKIVEGNLAQGVPEPEKTERDMTATGNDRVAAPEVEQKPDDASIAKTLNDAAAFLDNIMEYMTKRIAVLHTGKVVSLEELKVEKQQEIAWIRIALRPVDDEKGSPERKEKRAKRHSALLDRLRNDVKEIEHQIKMSKPELNG